MKTTVTLMLVALLAVSTMSISQIEGKKTDPKVTNKEVTHKYGKTSLLRYVDQNISRKLRDCVFKSSEKNVKLTAQLTINSRGKVVAASILSDYLRDNCLEQLKKDLMDLDGFSPAVSDGETTSGIYHLQIKIER